MDTISNTGRLAQSASALGAGLLGFAIGAKWGMGIGSTFLIVILIIGALIHVGGMYIMQMKNRCSGTIARILWVTAWLCLLALVALFIYLASR